MVFSRRRAASLSRILPAALVALLLTPAPSRGQDSAAAKHRVPTIENKTAGMQRLAGYFPLYWDADAGTLYMEIPRLDTEVASSFGARERSRFQRHRLDRATVTGTRIVRFERVGQKVLMVQPNYDFRSSSTNPAEVAEIRDAFARSTLWGFPLVAASDSGRRVLVEMNDFLFHDSDNLAQRLTPGTYRVDPSRSVIAMPMTQNFPKNTEMEAELTFVLQPGGGGRNPSGYFEGVGNVAATGEAASLRLHNSFVELPDTAGFTPRAYDPRSGFGAFSYRDYSAPLGQPMTIRYIPRHRLSKGGSHRGGERPREADHLLSRPGNAGTDPVGAARRRPLVESGVRGSGLSQCVPRGAPSRRRLAARYPLQHDQLGASLHPRLELRRRRDRPAHGRILKGVVTLGSLRVRQDWMIAEGLLQPYKNGDEQGPRDSGVGDCSGCDNSPRTRSDTRSDSITITTTATRDGSA